MKIFWNKKYNTVAVYACATAFVIITVICLFINLSAVKQALDFAIGVLAPVIWGFLFAYILFPLYKYLRDHAFPKVRIKKVMAVMFTYLSVILVVVIFTLFIAPQIVASYNDLQSRVGGYITTLQRWLEKQSTESKIFADQYKKLLEYANLNNLGEKLKQFVTGSFDNVISGTSFIVGFLGDVVTQIKNIAMGMIISVYLILWKEKLTAQAKKLLYAGFEQKQIDKIMDLLRSTDRTFGGFIVGKLIESLIMAIMTFVVLGFFDIPYYPLASVIIGVTQIIPFFGPFIGGILSAFIVFIADPGKTLWFLLLFILIQQINNIVIGPRILGNATGLDSLWVIVAIIVMSGFFGAAGLFIGVPLFAVLYTLVKQGLEKRLKRRGLPVPTEAYYGGASPESVGGESIDESGDGDAT